MTKRPISPRPLSPHLQIYRPQLTSLLSISHRLTGFALSMIFVVISPVMLYFLTYSQETHSIVVSILKHGLVKTLFSLAMFALVYHFFNGIRHLAWDAGYGLDLDSSYKSGYLVLAMSLLITLLILLLIGAL